MTYHARQDETSEWLNYLQPEGLVVGANVLRERGLTPIRQTPLDTEAAAQALSLDPQPRREDDRLFELPDPWRFFEDILGWPAKLVAGSPGGPAIPAELSVTVPEHETLLTPDMAVLWKGDTPEGVPVQALVMLHPSLNPDDRNEFPSTEWEASPHQRLERLLRETNVGVGILVARNTLRLIYAPRGETAGWLSWPLAALGRVEGRPMLAGLKLCLGRNAFFTGAPETRLRSLLEASREAQDKVSEKLSGQVLGALHELLRGLHRAAPDMIEEIAENDSHDLYEGLLTCLMRLVFLLYAEDRDLLPSASDPALKQLWERSYSVKTLYARLLTDEALNPDTMDERRGGWGQLLAVFRLIHQGYPGWVTGRGGKLFDPEGFPFLEGRPKGSEQEDAAILPVSDGCILRILHGLMTIEGRSLSGEKIRERISYRSLDVESIGSVYETVMGFTAGRAKERMIALKDEKKLPTFVGLDSLLAQKPADRQKWLKEHSIKLSTKQAKAVKEAGDVLALIEAFGALVDERATPKASPIGPGAPFLQPTEERRRSGSHYTPRSLTEPIVRQALGPVFARIGEKASPEAVLSLKVLDPACGSGAFLVEACRQLGQRLEQAWNIYGAEKPAIPPDEDEALHARRLVAQKCLYGVDRNPMAVDLSRLSLWLATLARDHEFTFLDHALKSGDSLVGLTRSQITAAHWDTSKPGLPLFGKMIKEALERALEGREAIRNASDDVLNEAQAARYARVQDASEHPRVIGDTVIWSFFSTDKSRGREVERQKVESWLTSATPEWDQLRAKASLFCVERGWHPFHWEIEFPEVFARENPGFDAAVGNPPFLGGTRISGMLGQIYLQFLVDSTEQTSGNVDLAAFFIRRADQLLRIGGAFGLVSTNSVRAGDSGRASLALLLESDRVLLNEPKESQWPGETANVAFLPICMVKHAHELVPAKFPHALAQNEGICNRGCDVFGAGFVLSEAERDEILALDPACSQVIQPFLGGAEFNKSPVFGHDRYIINFGTMDKAQASSFAPAFGRVESLVRPARASVAQADRRELWWMYATRAPKVVSYLEQQEQLLAVAQLSKHIAFGFLKRGTVFSNNLVLVLRDDMGSFCVLQSRIHFCWVARWAGAMRQDIRYTSTDCFETFPFPERCETDATLDAAGRTYHDHRAALMVAANEGMTKTYNRFHKSDERDEPIRVLRELHAEMDRAVLRAYGWGDLAEELHPEFLTEETEDDHTYQGRYFWPAEQRDRVLARLLALNAERHAEEVAAGLVSEREPRRSVDDDDEGQDGLDFR